MDTKELLYVWDYVDDAVQYISTDSDGWKYYHSSKPTIDIANCCFVSEEDNYDGYIECFEPNYNPYKGDWVLSLEARPIIDINKKPISSYTDDDYKLVPIVPTFEQLDSIKTCCEAMRRAQLSDLEAHGVYKTVIGILREI